MQPKPRPDRRCSYVVSIDDTAGASGDLRALAEYLSTLTRDRCEVIVFDSSSPEVFEEHQRVLRWVSRHVAVRSPHDVLRVVDEVASCEKLIVASEQVRCEAEDVRRLCALLEVHEVIEPQDYLEPLPWWAGIEAGSALVHRAIEPARGHAAVFGVRRSALRLLRRIESSSAIHPVLRLAQFGAEVFSAVDVFIRREPPRLGQWVRERPRAAESDLSMPAKSTFFFALLPLAILLAMAGGLRVAAGYAAAIALGAMVLGIRGRAGARSFFPLRASCYAPLWVLERSIAIYFALLRRLRSTVMEPAGAVATSSSGAKVASGE